MIASNCPYVFKLYALFIVCAFCCCLGFSWNYPPSLGILHMSPSCPVQMIFSRLCSPFEPLNLLQCQAKGGPARRAALGPSVFLFPAMPRPFRPLLAPQPISCSFCHMAAGPLSQFFASSFGNVSSRVARNLDIIAPLLK